VRFSSIHGLTRRDLAKAPAWPEVWAGVLDILGDVRTVVAFRASFDRGAILAMSARHGVRLPRLQFVCAAEMIEARYGLRASLSTSLEALGLQFPGSPHDPLADARAGAMVALACLAPSPTPAQAR
jgi:DNA polymerase III epsilon subunit-like protein